MWEGRGATARPREAKWSSGVAGVLGVYYSEHVFKNPFGHHHHHHVHYRGALYNMDASIRNGTLQHQWSTYCTKDVLTTRTPASMYVLSAAAVLQQLHYNSTTYGTPPILSLIHISEPTRLRRISYAVFCLKKKNILDAGITCYRPRREITPK